MIARVSAIVLVLGCGLTGSAQVVPLINTGPRLTVSPTAPRYGNILFPGGVPDNHISRLSATISGYPPYTGVGPGDPRSRRSRTVAVPYAYPVFIGGGYGYGGYGYQEAQQPSQITVVVQQQPSPPVVIHNYMAEPANQSEPAVTRQTEPRSGREGVSSYQAPGPQPPNTTAPASANSEKANVYLIALRDDSVKSAIGYWVQDKVLSYVTPEGSINRVSIEMVDRDASSRLNLQRKLDFQLEGR